MAQRVNFSLRSHQHRLPPVFLSASDHDRLAALAARACGRGARLLAHEVARATIVAPDQEAQAFVRLGSEVAFVDLASGASRTLSVVMPEAADPEAGRVSVLSPLGAALIGLSPGHSIGLSDASGRARVLKVTRVGGPHASL